VRRILQYWTSENGILDLAITLTDAQSGSHQGDCEGDVRALAKVPYIKAQLDKWDADQVREDLRGYDAWDEEELADDDMSLVRLLWLACGSVVDNAVEDGEPGPISPIEAYLIASEWGSFIHNGDPGAVFYTFPINDGRPQSEAHRQLLMDYCFDLIKELRDDLPEEELDDEARADIEQLRDLWQFFSISTLNVSTGQTNEPDLQGQG
jgi:hypothetical protein